MRKPRWKSRSLQVVVLGLTLTLLYASAGFAEEIKGPFIKESVIPKSSQAVRDLPGVQPRKGTEMTVPRPPRQVPPSQAGAIGQYQGIQGPDPLAGPPGRGARVATPIPMKNFEGLIATDNGASWGTPPDPIGDVGPRHYVQMVNSVFAVYDKAGNRLSGPTDINQLWAGAGGLCQNQNDGDPVVIHDIKADRWLLSQFAVPSGGPYAICIAVSQTPDPTGAYHLYEISTANFPDYFKIGAWPDSTYNGYFIAANESDVGVYALDRAKMLNGQPVTPITFQITNSNFMLPAHFTGAQLPPSGSPGYFYTFLPAGRWGATTHNLSIYEFKPDFTTPANSTFTRTQTINITPFNYTVCGYFSFDCVPQPATAQKVDAVSEWPMWRLQYRNTADHATLLGNFTVEVTGTPNGRAGIRWFELRNSGATWGLHQEGTYSPDTNWRWMGSIAMDGLGNIALGYSADNGSSLYPSLRYATRSPGDTLGTLGPETTLWAGGGSQTASNRWGDYSAMSVDPSDDCTFWYTNEYYSQSSAYTWHTRIGSFRMPDCKRPSNAPMLFELMLQ